MQGLAEEEPPLLHESVNLLSWADDVVSPGRPRGLRQRDLVASRGEDDEEEGRWITGSLRWLSRGGRKVLATGLAGAALLVLCVALWAPGAPSARWPSTRSASLSDKVDLASQGHSHDYEVMYEGFVNVRKWKSLSALILNTHWKCEIVRGVEEQGWVKLTNEPGFIKIRLHPYTLLRRVQIFREISHGACSSVGMYPIGDPISCIQAASSLGYHGPDLQRSRLVPAPEGCFMDAGKLFISDDRANRGNGVVGGQYPICSSVDGPIEDRDPCVPVEGHEPPETSRGVLLPQGRHAATSTTSTPEPTTTSTPEPTTTTTPEPTTTTTPEPTTTTTEVTTTAETSRTSAEHSSSTAEPTTTATTTTELATTTTTTLTFTTVTVTTTTTTVTTTTQAAPQLGARKANWIFPSLFCFEVTCVKPEDPNWYEPKLVMAQMRQKVSIFQCDEYTVFTNGGKLRLGNWTPTQLRAPRVGMGDLNKPGQTTNSWLNTLIFQQAWEEIKRDGRYRRHDWVVKCDPDAVFFPQRLRELVRPHSSPPGAWFYLNCNKYPPSPPGEAKLYGSVEVFSRKAVEAYHARKDECINGMKWQGWGEDYFMQKCMEKLNVMAVHNFGWIGDNRCWPAKCTQPDRVAFHDFKNIDDWFDCWGMSTEAR